MGDRRNQKKLRIRRNEQVFLFDESVSEPIATVDAFLWELAIADHGGRVADAAEACGITGVRKNTSALWGKSAEEARSSYRGWRRKRKKKQARTPRHKRMNPARLQSAKHWLQKYRGKSVIRGYRKHFAVDFRCAVRELEMLAVELDWDYVYRVCRLKPRPKEEN